MPGPFARALSDHQFRELRGPLRQRNGEETREHPIEPYFEPFDANTPEGEWVDSWLDEPLLEIGAGTGRHARFFQDRLETVAIERNEDLVAVLEDRGVEDVRLADFSDLRAIFDEDQFASVLVAGDQLSLTRSIQGLREFLHDLDAITTGDGTAVLNGLDPEHAMTSDRLDYRHDPAPGLGFRIIQFEYDGELGEPWLARLFTPNRVREAATGTNWSVADVRYGTGDSANEYWVALEKFGAH